MSRPNLIRYRRGTAALALKVTSLPSISIFFVTAIIVILHKFHVKLAEPKPCHVSVLLLLCRVNAHQCITAAHSGQLTIPLLDLLVIDQRIGQAFRQFAVCLCLCICGNGSLLGFRLCIGDRHLLIRFCLGNGGFILDLLLICILLCNGLLLDSL